MFVVGPRNSRCKSLIKNLNEEDRVCELAVQYQRLNINGSSLG